MSRRSERPEPTPTQRAAMDRVARFIVRFGMTTPAILSLETMRPLSYVGSQWMHVLSPSVGAFLTGPDWDALAELLEHRQGLDVVLEHLEHVDAHWREHGCFPELEPEPDADPDAEPDPDPDQDAPAAPPDSR